MVSSTDLLHCVVDDRLHVVVNDGGQDTKGGLITGTTKKAGFYLTNDGLPFFTTSDAESRTRRWLSIGG